jgi:hypothetical protein
MKHIWKKDGVEITHADMMKLYDEYENALTPDTTRTEAQEARFAIGQVEGDGTTILPETDPRKVKWFMYFGPFMVENNITYEATA